MLPSLHFKRIKGDIILHTCNDPGAGAAEISPTYESPKLRDLCAINAASSQTVWWWVIRGFEIVFQKQTLIVLAK